MLYKILIIGEGMEINFIIKKLNSLNKKIKSLENEIILSKENKKKLQETVLKIKDLEKFSN